MGGTRRQRRKTVALLVVAALAGGIGVAAYATHLLRRTELQTIDERYSIRGSRKPPSNIVFVAISLEAEKELEEHHLDARSPLPRKYDAQVIDHLRQAGAKAIAMDMEFTHPTNEEEDDDLIEAVGRAHGKVVLATTNVGASGETKIFGGAPKLLREIGARPADARLTLDPDGSVRRFERQYNQLESFPVVSAELMSGHRSRGLDVRAAAASRSTTSARPKAFTRSPTRRFCWASSRAARSRASSRSSEPPRRSSRICTRPPTTNGTMPGPEIWANATATLLEGVPLRDVPGWVNILAVLILGAVVPIGSLRVRQLALAARAPLALARRVHGRRPGRVRQRLDRFVRLSAARARARHARHARVLYVGETIERERVHDLFSRFVPADVVEQVVASAGDNLRLGRGRTRLHGAVLRPARVHELLREAARHAP